jgi:hypothetical protein
MKLIYSRRALALMLAPLVIAGLDPTVCTHLYRHRLTTKTVLKNASLFNVGACALHPALSTPMAI